MDQQLGFANYLTVLLRDEFVLFGIRYLIVGGIAVIGMLIFGRGYKKRIANMEKKLTEIKREHAQNAGANQPEEISNSADYIEACDIVDGYIHLAMRDKRNGVKLSVRRDFIERFEQTTGAMLGPHKYNRTMLHQWMQSNAAKFLVEHRGKMT